MSSQPEGLSRSTRSSRSPQLHFTWPHVEQGGALKLNPPAALLGSASRHSLGASNLTEPTGKKICSKILGATGFSIGPTSIGLLVSDEKRATSATTGQGLDANGKWMAVVLTAFAPAISNCDRSSLMRSYPPPLSSRPSASSRPREYVAACHPGSTHPHKCKPHTAHVMS